MRKQKAQSTVEYILLVSAVLVVVILFTTTNGTGGLQNRVGQVFSMTSQSMINVATKLSQ